MGSGDLYLDPNVWVQSALSTEPLLSNLEVSFLSYSIQFLIPAEVYNISGEPRTKGYVIENRNGNQLFQKTCDVLFDSSGFVINSLNVQSPSCENTFIQDFIL